MMITFFSWAHKGRRDHDGAAARTRALVGLDAGAFIIGGDNAITGDVVVHSEAFTRRPDCRSRWARLV